MSQRQHQGRYQKLSLAQIDQICLKHERFLKAKTGGQRASFAWADLTGMSLEGRNLSDSDFTAAILCDVNLTAAILNYSSFYCADLQNSRLESASLIRCDLRGVCLRGANLYMSDLTDSDLREGTLALPDKQMGLSMFDIEKLRTEAEGVNLRGANLSRSKLSGIQGIKADFTDAIMHQVRLQRANLKQAILTNADLAGADLSGADLSGADLTDAVLVGAKTEFMRTHHATMTGVLTDQPSGKQLDKPQFLEALKQHALWVRTGGAEGNVAIFDHHDLRGTGELIDMDLTALQAKNAIFFGMNLKGARLQGANLTGADLRHVNLSGADLRGIKLKGARLDGANLDGANLSPLSFTEGRVMAADLTQIKGRSLVLDNANLLGALLHGAEIIGASFQNAKLDPHALAVTNYLEPPKGPKAA